MIEDEQPTEAEKTWHFSSDLRVQLQPLLSRPIIFHRGHVPGIPLKTHQYIALSLANQLVFSEYLCLCWPEPWLCIPGKLMPRRCVHTNCLFDGPLTINTWSYL